MCKLRLISGAEAFQAVHGPSPLTQICGFSPWRGMFTFVLIIILRTNLKSSEPVHSGILPDAMHLAHLAIFSDVYISLLLDLTDDYTKRDSKLSELFENYYRAWCESQGNRTILGTSFGGPVRGLSLIPPQSQASATGLAGACLPAELFDQTQKSIDRHPRSSSAQRRVDI